VTNSWAVILIYYCAFHKHANSNVQKLPSQLCFSLPSIIITITSNEPGNTQNGSKSTDHQPWPFEPVKVEFCFLRGPLRWLMVAKNAIVSWLLNFRIRMFVKSAVKYKTQGRMRFHSWKLALGTRDFLCAISGCSQVSWFGPDFWHDSWLPPNNHLRDFESNRHYNIGWQQWDTKCNIFQTVLFMLGKQCTLVLRCWKFESSNDGRTSKRQWAMEQSSDWMKHEANNWHV